MTFNTVLHPNQFGKLHEAAITTSRGKEWSQQFADGDGLPGAAAALRRLAASLESGD